MTDFRRFVKIGSKKIEKKEWKSGKYLGKTEIRLVKLICLFLFLYEKFCDDVIYLYEVYYVNWKLTVLKGALTIGANFCIIICRAIGIDRIFAG